MRQKFNAISAKFARKKAFTLIELSIVITVIAVIAAMMLPNRNAHLVIDKAHISHDRIQAIYQAMGQYLVANGKLPCPAPITAIKATSTTYGVASIVDGDCAYSTDGSTDGVYKDSTTSFVYGMVPVVTLGLGEEFAEDGFGSKFDYIVHQDFTSATTFGTALTDTINAITNSKATGMVVIINEFTDITIENSVQKKAVMLIISHGANKLASFDANSSSISTSAVISAENDNSAVSHDDSVDRNTVIFSKTKYMKSANLTSTLGRSYYPIIDDIVFFKTRDDFIRDFNAYGLIPCQDDGYNQSLSYGGTSMVWPDETLYGQDAVSETECPDGYDAGAKYPTKRCGPFGVWSSYVVVACEQP